MRRLATILPWLVWIAAIPVLITSWPTEAHPLSRGQQVLVLATFAAIAAAHVFSAIYLFVDARLPANAWQPITGDVFAWFRPWFVFVRGHALVVTSWRAACEVLRARLAALGYTAATAAATGRYTATMLFVHADKPAVAAVELTIDRAPRLRLSFISFVDDKPIITATDIEKRGGALPHEMLPSDAEVHPGLAPGSLLGEHERRGRGRRATVDEIAAALAASAAARRRAFLARPVRNLWRAWWRASRR